MELKSKPVEYAGRRRFPWKEETDRGELDEAPVHSDEAGVYVSFTAVSRGRERLFWLRMDEDEARVLRDALIEETA